MKNTPDFRNCVTSHRLYAWCDSFQSSQSLIKEGSKITKRETLTTLISISEWMKFVSNKNDKAVGFN